MIKLSNDMINILDARGSINGVFIDDVNIIHDIKHNQATIYGFMKCPNSKIVSFPSMEPEVNLVVYNDRKIIYTATSAHIGVFWVTRYVNWSIHIPNVSRILDGNKVSRIDLFIIFRKK